MTDIIDIFETFVGVPANNYESALMYMVATIFAFMLLFMLFDLFYLVVGRWR